MKTLTIVFLFLVLFVSKSFAEYVTPGTGVKWNLTDLVTNSGGAVTFSAGVYTFNDSIKVRKGDTLFITTDGTIKIAANKVFTVSGVLLVNPPTGLLVTALDTNNRYTGIRLDSTNSSVIRKMTLEYASGGLKVTDCSPMIDSCIFQKNNTVTGFNNGTLATFRTTCVIQNCKFINNQRAAIQGGANIANAPRIINCYFLGNNILNGNVPQINMGATGTDTIKIIGNQILRASTNSGGIGFLPTGTCNVLITGNVIKNNRYGINLQGGNTINALVSYNQIDSNNTQNNPALGGSGIAFSGGAEGNYQNSIVTGNLLRWNLWGITIQGRAKPNLGNINNTDTTDNGKNSFVNNFTRGIDLFNTTPDSIYAQNNFWNTIDPDSVEMKIFHKPDTTANYGLVIFMPFIGPSSTGQEYTSLPSKFSIEQNYPNPFNPVTKIEYSLPFTSNVEIKLYDMMGREVMTLANSVQTAGYHSVILNGSRLSSGAYFYKISASGGNQLFVKTLKLLLVK
jgi:hypothetical protein